MIPNLDSQIGITIYSTEFNGIGGKIRVDPEDFQVTEIISQRNELTKIRNVGDSIKGGSNLINPISDGTNTCITLETVFTSPVVLDSREGDKISVTINDDLTGLISFTALAIGFNRLYASYLRATTKPRISR